MKVIQVWIDKGSGFRQMIFDDTAENRKRIVELVKEALENGWLMQIY
jgi:hypothetical protein